MEESLRERIAKRAYELYQKRGKHGTNSMQDWLEAEREVMTESNPAKPKATKKAAKKAPQSGAQAKAPKKAAKSGTTKKMKSSTA
jgi:hypothetical protein